VARSYLDLARECTRERTHGRRAAAAPEPPSITGGLPEVDLRHLRSLTDDTGIVQHAFYCVPDRQHGYTTDDNARALNAVSLHWLLHHDEGLNRLSSTYLAFLAHAFNDERRRFRNFMSYDRAWLEEEGSEDAHGRALWALGLAAAQAPNPSALSLAVRMFNEAMPATESFTSLRAVAYTLIGIQAYLACFPGDASARRRRKTLAYKLYDHYNGCSSDDWPWFENRVTYANARLPHALILAAQWIPDTDMGDAALRALDWLLEVQTSQDGHLSLIGSNGWYDRGGERAPFDQQPIEAMGLVEACSAAYMWTRHDYWIEQARRCLDWFLGRNDLGVSLYDPETGGCRDGLHPDGPNQNQGAESTLSWLISLLTFLRLTHLRRSADTPEDTTDTDRSDTLDEDRSR
jgi:hypothetical protein